VRFPEPHPPCKGSLFRMARPFRQTPFASLAAFLCSVRSHRQVVSVSHLSLLASFPSLHNFRDGIRTRTLFLSRLHRQEAAQVSWRIPGYRHSALLRRWTICLDVHLPCEYDTTYADCALRAGHSHGSAAHAAAHSGPELYGNRRDK
jgi:hypothetical protein